jgi:hypothetical protein
MNINEYIQNYICVGGVVMMRREGCLGKHPSLMTALLVGHPLRQHLPLFILTPPHIIIIIIFQTSSEEIYLSQEELLSQSGLGAGEFGERSILCLDHLCVWTCVAGRRQGSISGDSPNEAKKGDLSLSPAMRFIHRLGIRRHQKRRRCPVKYPHLRRPLRYCYRPATAGKVCGLQFLVTDTVCRVMWVLVDCIPDGGCHVNTEAEESG